MATQTLENSNPRLLITEVLRKVSNAKTKAEKLLKDVDGILSKIKEN